ncbi:MAG: chromosome segregation protein SMC [Acidobacteria bacterium RIFCSPLOWO2_02_FULL_61_28]|nr:MAG: chromosome segregation protein SMC [Acidobacteria bacterium RIFCSPLOWO2_02_FULL_61_28]
MKTATAAVLRFTHLGLENWRNFTRVDVELPRRAFLVGANASGKSNLLDVFRFLHDIVSVGGGFQAAVRKRGGVSRLRCLAARRYPEIAITVNIGSDADEHAWEYELRFTHDKLQRPVIQKEQVRRNRIVLLDRPLPEDRKDPERLTQTYLEQVNVNQPFRTVAEFFSTVRYLHIVPQLVRDPDRSSGRRDDPYGGDFLERVARTSAKTRAARLRRIRGALRVAVPQLEELEFCRDARGAPHLRAHCEHWRPSGAWQTEEQLSDGTLRLMGLLWAMLDGTGPLLLEEPEMSLHPDVARLIPQMLARVEQRMSRQVLVSTHSTDILQDEGIGLDELLLLEPGAEGTSIRPAGDFAEIKAMLQGGTSLAEAALPRTGPPKALQLTLFGG